MKVYLYVLN